MKERTLLNIALATALVGIVSLFFLAQQMSVDEAMLNRLDQMIDEAVLVTGIVLDVNTLEDVTFLRIEKTELTEVVLFGPAPMLEMGDLVQVRGKVAEHEGETEVIGEEVRVI
ncbi:MAG: hypothetical protein V1729_00980 [Candidatus Woesearchaeota archaeon]